MNEFKEEFSQLILRYGSSDNNNNNKTSEPVTKLTNQQIVEIIQEVILVAFKINLQNMEDTALKTPANEIVITTPNAPDVLRVDYNQNNTLQTRYKFLEALGKEYDDNYLESCNLSSLSNHSDEMTETPDNKSSINETDIVTQKKKKNDIAISNKSLQGMNITYVRGSFLNKSRQERAKPGPATNITMYMVEEAYKNAVKVSKKLEDLKELLTSETKSSQRLSSIMRLPVSNQHHHHHQQQTASSIQRAKALRRHVQQSIAEAPVTPTSSRPSRAPPPPKKTQTHLSRVSENRTLTDSASRSPSKTNPKTSAKYAHVQSTIPKPVTAVVKRKA